MQEHGETQEFADDIEYLLAGLKEGEPMSTRCLRLVENTLQLYIFSPMTSSSMSLSYLPLYFS